MDVLANIDPTSSDGSAADPFRPSFFELIAQKQLSDLLKPAIRYVLTVLAQHYPRYLLRIVNRFDELYAVLMLAVERHYLRTWNASFTEHFYGLRRRRRPAVSTKRLDASVPPHKLHATRQLRDREVNVSLLFLVGLPYLEAKLSDYWERLGGGVVIEGDSGDDLFADEETVRLERSVSRQETPAQRIRSRLKMLFRRGFPLVQVGLQLWILAYHIKYLFGITPYWRPWLAAMRVDVRRAMGNETPLRLGAASKRLPQFSRFPLLFMLRSLQKGGAHILDALKYALPASIFFFKVLEWWYSPNNRRRGDDDESKSRKVLGPPVVSHPSSSGVLENPHESYRDPKVLKTKNQTPYVTDADDEIIVDIPSLLHNSCPICGAMPIQNPCALPTGFAFCYRCATDYVDKWHVCPVTQIELPGGIEQIRRVLV